MLPIFCRVLAPRSASPSLRLLSTTLRLTSTNSKPETTKEQAKTEIAAKIPDSSALPKKPRKTQAQLDEELRLKMAGLAGDGGESGIEYEDGQPVAMKRGVKNNMFRYI